MEGSGTCVLSNTKRLPLLPWPRRMRSSRYAQLSCTDDSGPTSKAAASPEDGGGEGRDALEGKGPQRRARKRLGRRLEEVAKAVRGGYCRL